MKHPHPFPSYRTCTLTRFNVCRAVAQWRGAEPPTPREIAVVLVGQAACVTPRHVRRVERLRREA
jgi:hypothetical protein